MLSTWLRNFPFLSTQCLSSGSQKPRLVRGFNFLRPGRINAARRRRSWVEIARNIEARRNGVYDTTREELIAIDEALGQIARGEVATELEVEAAFSNFCGA